MKRLHSLTAIALTGMVGFTSICAPIAAQASEEGKRNTAIGLGVAAAALLLTQKNKTPGLVVAGGAILAASQLGHDRDRDHGRYDYRYDRNDHRFDRDDHRFDRDDRRFDRDDHRFDRDHRDDRNRDDHRDNRDNGYRLQENGDHHRG